MRALLKLLLITSLLRTASAEVVTNVDLTGTWRIDPKTVRMGVLPTNFLGFALILNADGAFIATNVPAGFFSSPSAVPEARGTWSCKYSSRDDVHYFGLSFDVPKTQGYYGTMLKWRRSGLAFISPWEPLIRIYISHKRDQSDALEFGLARQKEKE
jgi:hypothetical protein